MKFTESIHPDDRPALTYRSETVIRAEDKGLVLSMGFSSVEKNGNSQFNFGLLYLEKTVAGWEIKWEHKYEQEPSGLTWQGPYSLLLPNGQIATVGMDSRGVDPEKAEPTEIKRELSDSWIGTPSDSGDMELFYSAQNLPNTAFSERDWFLDKNEVAGKVYEPLKAIKGTGKDIHEYCDGAKFWRRNGMAAKVSEHMKNLCYRPKVS